MLVCTRYWVSNGMPNKRHPTRKYIGFWATDGLKQKLRKLAAKREVTLSVLILKILFDYVNGTEILFLVFNHPQNYFCFSVF
jgi:hypothetical protein